MAEEAVFIGTFCTERHVWTGWLTAQAGRVRAIGTGPPPRAAQVWEYPGGLILPGLVDPHVHFREPGLSHKETFTTGSMAAVAGGVTTVLDMPNTAPPATSGALLAVKAMQARGRFWTDYGFHVLYTGENLADLIQLEPGSVASVKVFMAGHATTPYVVAAPEPLRRLFRAMAQRGIPVTVHAEDGLRIAQEEAPTQEAYTESRPPETAAGAVERVIGLAQETGCRVHVVHVSTAAELDLLMRARRHGLPVTWEFIHPHLSFTAEQFHQLGGAWLKLSPPLRSRSDQAALWSAIQAGAVDCLASDHAPHTCSEKERPFARAPAGMPGVQESLLAIFTGLCGQGFHPVEAARRIAGLMAAAPARLFGLPRKGGLAQGMDADLVVLRPDQTWAPARDPLYSGCGWSPYAGRVLLGRVHATFLRGRPVYEAGRFVGLPSGEAVYAR